MQLRVLTGEQVVVESSITTRHTTECRRDQPLVRMGNLARRSAQPLSSRYAVLYGGVDSAAVRSPESESVLLNFDPGEESSRASTLRRGDTMSAIGQIKSASRTAIKLVHCEFESS